MSTEPPQPPATADQMRKLFSLIVIIAVFGFALYFKHHEEESVRSMDLASCWTDQCKTDILLK